MNGSAEERNFCSFSESGIFAVFRERILCSFSESVKYLCSSVKIKGNLFLNCAANFGESFRANCGIVKSVVNNRIHLSRDDDKDVIRCFCPAPRIADVYMIQSG